MTEIAFVIPLKSRVHSREWSRTCGLLQATLRSMSAQTCKDFRILLICNEAPDRIESHERLEVLQTDIRIDGTYDLRKARLDKQRKTLLGLLEARKFDPKRVMVMDADDLLHRDVVRFASHLEHGAGLILNRGYRYNFLRPILRRCLNYHHLSGSSLIFPYSAHEFDGINSHDEVSKHYISRQAHPRPAEEIFRLNSMSYQYVPFYAGIYVRGYNHSLRDQFVVEESGAVTRRNGISPARIKRRTTDLGWKLLGRAQGSRKIDNLMKQDFPGLDVLQQLSEQSNSER